MVALWLIYYLGFAYQRGLKAAGSDTKWHGSFRKARRAQGGECSRSCPTLWGLQEGTEIGSEAFAPQPEPRLYEPRILVMTDFFFYPGHKLSPDLHHRLSLLVTL